MRPSTFVDGDDFSQCLFYVVHEAASMRPSTFVDGDVHVLGCNSRMVALQ